MHVSTFSFRDRQKNCTIFVLINLCVVNSRPDILAPNAHYYTSIKKATPKNQSVKWGSGTILNIIRNPVYKGVMVNGKRKVMSFKNKRVIANPSDT